MTDILLVPATVEPLTLAKAKQHLKVSVNAEDTLISSWIAAARSHAERFMTKAIVQQTRRMLLDCFPACIDIDWGPLRAVQSIQYLDSAGVLQTLATDQYRVDKLSSPARIVPEYAVTWPVTRPVPNAVMVTYTAGVLAPFTADATSDVLTAPGHGLADGDVTQVVTLGIIPAGLAEGTNYYAISSMADTLKLSATSGGVAIDITGAGTSPNLLGRMPREIEAALQVLVQFFEAREADEGLLETAECLLEQFRVVRF